MFARMFRAMRLDASLYEEVEASPAFSTEAFQIVLIVAVLNGIVTAIVQTLMGSSFSIMVVLGYAIVTLVGYFVSTFLVWVVGVSIFGGVGTFDELRRSIGYAYSPYVFAGIPCVNFLVIFWAMATFYVAVRQTLDISSGKTIVVIIVAGIGQLVLYGILGAVGLAATMSF